MTFATFSYYLRRSFCNEVWPINPLDIWSWDCESRKTPLEYIAWLVVEAGSSILNRESLVRLLGMISSRLIGLFSCVADRTPSTITGTGYCYRHCFSSTFPTLTIEATSRIVSHRECFSVIITTYPHQQFSNSIFPY